ncbi:MAG TPA: hypothetical protein VIQ22_08430 [Gammaproteobacteria bacterium]
MLTGLAFGLAAALATTTTLPIPAIGCCVLVQIIRRALAVRAFDPTLTVR